MDKALTIRDWILKQAPVIVILIGTNVAQYNYFTKQITKLEDRIEKLQDKIINNRQAKN